uniref:tRNA (32-2'-O)-methyltransferase regulator THADA n=1 Tax=Syphacia muris TaxID=451379 RepID=A0A0N5ANV0_9BILA
MEPGNLSVSKEIGDLCKLLNDKGSLPESFGFLLKKTNSNWLRRCCNDHECFIVDCCLKNLLNLASDDTSKWLLLEFQESVLNVIYNFWDYTLEAICYICVHAFGSLMTIHQLSCDTCRINPCQWILGVEKLLFESSQHCSGRFRCIVRYLFFILLKIFQLLFVKNFGFVKQIPAHIIVEAYNCLVIWSHNAAAKELIVFDLVNSLSDLDRCNLHKCNILEKLKSEDESSRLSVVERLLPAFCTEKQLIDWIGTDLITSVSGHSNEYDLYAMLSLAKIYLLNQNKIGGHKSWQDVIERDRIVHGLVHSKSYIRLSAWMVLTEDRRMSKFFSKEELGLIKVFLLASFAEQSPALRQKILAGLKKVFIRIHQSAFVLKKSGDSVGILKFYEDFIYWLKKICFNWLEKGANFNRRLMALSVLQYIYVERLFCDHITECFFNRVKERIRLTDEDLCNLVGCFDDSYQLCQLHACKILAAPDLQLLAPFNLFDFEMFFTETFNKILSLRSLDTEASGNRLKFYLLRFPSRILENFDTLFNICKKRVELISESLLAVATENGFLHSILNSIKITLLCVAADDLLSTELSAEWEHRLLHNLPQLCFKVADLVSPIVQALSPEGYLSEGTAASVVSGTAEKEHGNIQKSEFTQFFVACCWRAHKGITEIFYTLLKKYPLEKLNQCGFIDKVGKFYQEQLTICRHCGAFGCAVNSFEELCGILWSSSLNSRYCVDLSIPDGWLQEVLDSIQSGEHGNFCSARRSAGLPYLVCSILCYEPDDRNCYSLKRTLVHCVNILRKLFADSRLSEKISWALEEALHLCIKFYASPHWTLRNACAQLFAVLINQIFGSFLKSIFCVFLRFSFMDVLMFQQLLASCSGKSDFEVFPALTLLTHLYPSSLSNSNLLSKYIFPTLRLALKCKSEKLRRLSVAALVSICELQLTTSSTEYELVEFKFLLESDRFLHYLLWNELLENDHKTYSEELFVMAFEDMNWCDELTIAKILNVMVNIITEVDFCNISNEIKKKLKDYLINNLSNSRCENDYVYALRFIFLDKSYWNIERLRECARREDVNARQLAFSILRHLLNRGVTTQDLIEVCCLFLQDDEAVMREEASLLLSRSLHLKFELCPQLILWLILTRFPSLSKKVVEVLPSEKSGNFFDPCAENVYAESRAYGMEYFTDIDEFLGIINNSF